MTPCPRKPRWPRTRRAPAATCRLYARIVLFTSLELPRQLPAPAPGWTLDTDVCVVGSGVAGLTVALAARRAGLRVTVVTKVRVDDGSTRWAQGGIAAALAAEDSPADHAADTLAAGVDLCDPAAVNVLVTEGPQRLRELIALGAQFDRNLDGSLLLTREGGHHIARIAHSRDATGVEVQRALHEAVFSDAGIELVEHALVVDLLRADDGAVCGVTLHVLGEGRPDGVGAIRARAVVLATGGLGQVFDVTTNPGVSTGDGLAVALRAGAALTDVEFVQFHPTALYLGPGHRGRQPLITEALRGEGALLLDGNHERFMVGHHPLAELAPRDVVAKHIVTTMRDQGLTHVLLDARQVPNLRERFPTIVANAAEAGVDPTTEFIPVAPAAHYASGGIATDLWGRTNVAGLYACGEAACTGVHGANRLASNSLLEGLVFASRIGVELAENLPPSRRPVLSPADGQLVAADSRAGLTAAMSNGAGLVRSADSLQEAAEAVAKAAASTADAPRPAVWETTNVVTVAAALVAAAQTRTETRGCHWRSDFPDTDPLWRRRVAVSLRDGALTVTTRDME